MERELPQEARIKWYAYGLTSGMYNRDKNTIFRQVLVYSYL